MQHGRWNISPREGFNKAVIPEFFCRGYSWDFDAIVAGQMLDRFNRLSLSSGDAVQMHFIPRARTAFDSAVLDGIYFETTLL